MAGRILVLLVLGALVAGLALRYLRGRRADASVDATALPQLPAALRAPATATWVIFTTPLCASCDAVEAQLRAAHPADAVLKVDATREPALAERYRVRRAPTVVHADPSGRVIERLVGAEAVREHVTAR
jgi:hypothetical protein